MWLIPCLFSAPHWYIPLWRTGSALWTTRTLLLIVMSPSIVYSLTPFFSQKYVGAGIPRAAQCHVSWLPWSMCWSLSGNRKKGSATKYSYSYQRYHNIILYARREFRLHKTHQWRSDKKSYQAKQVQVEEHWVMLLVFMYYTRFIQNVLRSTLLHPNKFTKKKHSILK